MKKIIVFSLLISVLMHRLALADYTLGIQPILPEEETRKAYQPLADYLSSVLETPVHIVTQPSFLHYGLNFMDSKTYDFTLDAVHLSAYRSDRVKSRILAKVEGKVSYTLVARSTGDIVEAVELIGKPVATLSAPSMGAIALAELFVNPVRQPRVVEVATSRDAIRWLREGRVEAAMVPTPLLSRAGDMVPVYQTELYPHMAFSMSSRLQASTGNLVKRALVTAKFTAAGQAMLKAINFSGFEAADEDEYRPFAKKLRGAWTREKGQRVFHRRLREDIKSARHAVDNGGM